MHLRLRVKKKDRVVKILMTIFAFRPIIDLAWESDIVFGLNLAGIIAILVIVLSFLYIVKHPLIKKNNLTVSSIVFVLYIWVITLVFASGFSDFDLALRVLSSMCFLFVVAPNVDEEDLKVYLIIYIIMTIIPIILTYGQVVGIVEYTYYDYVDGSMIYRGSGGYRQPSVLTRFCIFGLMFVLYLLDEYAGDIRKIVKICAYVYIVMNVAAIILSYHRTGYLLLALMLFLWFALKYKGNFLKLAGKVLLAIVVGIVVFAILYQQGIISVDPDTFKSMFSLSNIYSAEQGLVLRGRGNLIKKLVQGFSENPWYNTVFGNGVNTNAVSGISMKTADMDFIRIIWNTGIVGTILWILNIVSLALATGYSYRVLEGSAFSRLGVCVVINYLVWGLTLETMGTPNIIYVLYLIVGVLFYEARKNLANTEMI